MDKKTRTYEEIITLQDKAIEALTQANAALVMALEALKKARAEHGLPLQFPGFQTLGGLGHSGQSGQIGNSAPYIGPYENTYTMDPTQPQWTMNTPTVNFTAADKVLATSTLISQANSQKALAEAYIGDFQAWVKKEQDEVSKMGGCL